MIRQQCAYDSNSAYCSIDSINRFMAVSCVCACGSGVHYRRYDNVSLVASILNQLCSCRLNWTAQLLSSIRAQFFLSSLVLLHTSHLIRSIERITTSEIHNAPNELFRNFWLQLIFSIWFTMHSFDNVAFDLLFLLTPAGTHTHTGHTQSTRHDTNTFSCSRTQTLESNCIYI